jgi:hypothetical protein
VRQDDGGKTSSETLYEGAVVKFTGAASYGREAGFANVCDRRSSMAKLTAGTYWVVAHYDILPTTLPILGDDASPPLNLNPIMASDDGVAWTQYQPTVWYNGTRNYTKLEFFLSQ